MFAGRVGARDAAYHRRELARAGVRAHLAADREAETGSIVIMVAPDGERTMFTDRGANLRLRRSDVPAGLLDGAAALHLTGYTFCEPPLLEVALWLLEQARARELAVTIDPGSAAFLARLEPKAFLRWTEGAAVCFPNRDEAAVLTGEPDPVSMAARLTRHYGVVVVKLGGAGCVLATPGEAPVLIAAHPARATDTTGAGDAFCGAFLSKWLAAVRPPPGPGWRGGVRGTDRRHGRDPLRRSSRVERSGKSPAADDDRAGLVREAGWMGDFELSAAEFRALYQRVKHMSQQGPADRRGALNNTSPTDVVTAASGVWRGHAVSLAAPVEIQVALDNPDPAVHQMTHTGTSSVPAAGLSFAMDRLAMNIHGNTDSHIDALCHVIFDGTLYNDISADAVTATGATELSIEEASGGIVGRGVLLDIPRVRRVPWLDPGDHVTADDLIAAEAAQEVRIEPGDLLFIRVGHRSRRTALGPWDVANARAGLHPAALELLAERRIAVLGSDGNNDTAPSAAEGVDFPVHVLAVNAMGLHLLDWLQFDNLVAACEELNRWSFLCVIAPLRLRAGTGSPVNPIAIF